MRRERGGLAQLPGALLPDVGQLELREAGGGQRGVAAGATWFQPATRCGAPTGSWLCTTTHGVGSEAAVHTADELLPWPDRRGGALDTRAAFPPQPEQAVPPRVDDRLPEILELGRF